MSKIKTDKGQTFRYLLMLLAAFIWGSAFVAQSVGMDYIGPFAFSFTRNYIGSLVLVPVVLLINSAMRKRAEVPLDQSGKEIPHDVYIKNTVKGGIVCGIVLCFASNLQQFALITSTAGKAGFITALYVVLVPVFGLFLHKRVAWLTWIAVVLSVIGLYLLSIKPGEFSIGHAELLLLVCAFGFMVHILVIDHFAVKSHTVMMASIQFFVCGTISMILMFIFEDASIASILAAKGPILYAGLLSSGVAYTLQIVGQKGTNPTLASLILSLESVFAVISGYFILGENLTPRELTGCVIMFVAIVLSQII